MSQNIKVASSMGLMRLAVFTLMLLQLSNLGSCAEDTSLFNEPNDSEYDPEKAADGPTTPKQTNAVNSNQQPPVYQWNTEDERRPSMVARRVDDRDPEDEFDDDERDEAKSGSSQHGTVEEPAFGESLKAAKDGEEIESFFDKHLGPQEPAAESSNQVDKETQARDAEAETERPASSVERADPEDKYEMAASSPLSGIIHSLITGHKPRIVIKTVDELPSAARPSGSLASASTSTSQQQQLAPQSQQKSANMAAGPVASPGSQLGPYVQGSPFLDEQATMGSTMGPLPVPFHGPMAQGSVAMGQQHSPAATHINEDHGEPPIREIYIARRPSVLQHFRSHASALGPPIQRLVQQTASSSLNQWQQQQPIRQDDQSAASSDFMNRHPMTNHLANYGPMMHQASMSQQPQMGGYYPMAANSYARQQAYRFRGARPESGDSEEPTTVSYGLRFGSSSLLGGPSSSEEDESSSENSGDDQSSASNDQVGPTQGGYHGMPVPGRYASSGSRAYNSYNSYPWPAAAAGAGRGYMGYPNAMASQQYQQQQQMAYQRQLDQQQQLQQQQQQMIQQKRLQQHQHHHHGAGYHKDPTDSAPMTNYGQLSPFLGSGSSAEEHQSWTRRKLLADLDHQIKSNPHYRNNHAPQSATNSKALPIKIQSKFMARINNLDKDVDSYSSFHSETDPFKSITTSAKLVKDNDKQNDSDDADDGMDAAATKNQVDDQVLEPRRDIGNSSTDTESRQFRLGKDQTDRCSVQVIDSNSVAQNSELNNPATALGAHKQPTRDQLPSQNDNGQLKFGAKISNAKSLHRVRREDPDDRESDDVDDDGVWVDDDDDDDNKQTASDVNETTQEPAAEGDDESQQNGEQQGHFVPGVIGNPHGYEISP